MGARDYRDIIGGVALVFIGCFTAIHALTSLNLGTVASMGSGMVPTALGCMLIVLGLAIVLPALFRAGEMPRADLRSTGAILASILAFAIMVRPFGMIPAILVLTFVVSRADSRLSPIGTLILATGLSLLAVLIFRVGLGAPVEVIAWPW